MVKIKKKKSCTEIPLVLDFIFFVVYAKIKKKTLILQTVNSKYGCGFVFIQSNVI